MRLDKIVLKAFLKTLAAALLLLAIMVGVLAVAFPHTMMELTYSLGMDKASVSFSVTSYERFHRVDYIAKGADTALAAKLHKQADECLELLIADEDFMAYCETRNASLPEDAQGTTYQAYCYRQLCLAKYMSGNGSAAVERAVELMAGTFVQGNPLVSVLAQARMDKADGVATVKSVHEKMLAIKGMDVYANYSVEDKAYFDQVYASAEKWANESTK